MGLFIDAPGRPFPTSDAMIAHTVKRRLRDHRAALVACRRKLRHYGRVLERQAAAGVDPSGTHTLRLMLRADAADLRRLVARGERMLRRLGEPDDPCATVRVTEGEPERTKHDGQHTRDVRRSA